MATRRSMGGGAGHRRWSQGGTKRRKNYIAVDFSNFEFFAEELDKLNADLQKIFGDAMEQAGETVQDDVVDGVSSANLPAGGHYSNGETEASVIQNPRVTWSGSVGEIGLGFDKTKPGAGGFLITGTPFMHPDYKLVEIFTNKRYTKKIVDQINEDLQEALDRLRG